mgnify:CR=1 FL=1
MSLTRAMMLWVMSIVVVMVGQITMADIAIFRVRLPAVCITQRWNIVSKFYYNTAPVQRY